MTLFRANFADRSKPVIKEPEPELLAVERDRTTELIGIVEAVYEAARKGESLEELKRWAVEVWDSE
jgi:hypothetical protein